MILSDFIGRRFLPVGGFDKESSLIVRNFKNLANHFVAKLSRKYWVKLPTFQRSNSVTQELPKDLTRYLITNVFNRIQIVSDPYPKSLNLP